jgi:hypothetical protein
VADGADGNSGNDEAKLINYNHCDDDDADNDDDDNADDDNENSNHEVDDDDDDDNLIMLFPMGSLHGDYPTIFIANLTCSPCLQ